MKWCERDRLFESTYDLRLDYPMFTQPGAAVDKPMSRRIGIRSTRVFHRSECEMKSGFVIGNCERVLTLTCRALTAKPELSVAAANFLCFSFADQRSIPCPDSVQA